VNSMANYVRQMMAWPRPSLSEEEIRADERRKCWEEINAWIVHGPLPGDGWDPSAQRNGLIMATNILLQSPSKPESV